MDRTGKRLQISWRVGIGLSLILQAVHRIRFWLFRGFFMICLEARFAKSIITEEKLGTRNVDCVMMMFVGGSKSSWVTDV